MEWIFFNVCNLVVDCVLHVTLQNGKWSLVGYIVASFSSQEMVVETAAG